MFLNYNKVYKHSSLNKQQEEVKFLEIQEQINQIV